MRILHTEASNGWGGQEMRILREAQGMREKGHELFFANVEGGELASRARQAGFVAYEIPLDKKKAWSSLKHLMQIIRKHRIEIVNTHSSSDAWLGGIAARLTGAFVIRTRHLSTKIRGGLNAYLLYRILADRVVTTCESTAETIRLMTKSSSSRCLSIPTGVDISRLAIDEATREGFRKNYGIASEDCVVGTVCVFRSWKGLADLLKAAYLLKDMPHVKWLFVGSGPMDPYLRDQCQAWGLEKQVIFTGFLENPFQAIAGMDVFALLSTMHEGVSQASLQAAYLEKPLITTKVGGLPEVNEDGQTGYTVEVSSPEQVAEKVKWLVENEALRKEMGKRAKEKVKARFSFEATLEGMEKVYKNKL